ncbi:hypothetical protein D3C77_704870 [compost metagenome]
MQYEGGVAFVQLPGDYPACQRRVPHVQAARRGRRIREGVGADRQQRDGHAQLRGPLDEQVTTGNGDQGVGLGVLGEQQAQVRSYAGRLAGCQGEALVFHCAA